MDLSTWPNASLISLMRQGELTNDIIDELEKRLQDHEEVFVLPVSISDAIRSYFGGGRRTFDALNRRIRFAYKVWQGKYGPWTPEQAEYAESLILWAVNRAATAENAGHMRPRVYLALDTIVNHENTHDGFKRREGATVDITAHLAGLGDAA